ncbi:hypothetical protein [Roseitalea porphyridii]|uniref:Uncharacterized protein n=1 Tax=Roseitalea porphyridii TaxID=1852022 RepID=A0A4P6V299_9HYPH|nr:hypothetical protein [Roseitalea porphyridii]QBK30550.1 hypothetical protein E0E05_08035 [Roseitalea porphyridii]
MAHIPQIRARRRIVAAAIAVPTAMFVLPMPDPDDAIGANRLFSASTMASDVSSGKRAGLPVLPVADARTITVDSDFEDRFGFLVPQPFSLDLPDPGDGEIKLAYPDTAGGVYLRISISTLEGVGIYTLSGTHAVVLNGTYRDPRAGDIAVRIYGIMHKRGVNGLIFYERRYVERAPASARFSEQIVRSVVFQ